MKEINETNVAFGLKKVSISNLSKIRASKFPEYEVKKPGDNFTRCTNYDNLQELRKGALVSSHSTLKWSKRLDKHFVIAYYRNTG